MWSYEEITHRPHKWAVRLDTIESDDDEVELHQKEQVEEKKKQKAVVSRPLCITLIIILILLLMLFLTLYFVLDARKKSHHEDSIEDSQYDSLPIPLNPSEPPTSSPPLNAFTMLSSAPRKVEENEYQGPQWKQFMGQRLTEAQNVRDSYPPVDSGIDLSKKYMFYRLGMDHGAGLLHFTRSLWAMTRESKRLGRVCIWSPVFIPPWHNNGTMELKDPVVLYNKALIEKEFPVEIMNENEFFGRLKKSKSEGVAVSHRVVGPWEETKTGELLGEDSVFLERDYNGTWDKYLFKINKDPELQDIPNTHHYAPHLLALGEAIVAELKSASPDYDCVHVRRGNKKDRRREWPNLDNDTQPEQLIKKLSQYIQNNRLLYIATDEYQPGFFDPLRDFYYLKLTDDFKHLWGKGSAWYDANVALVGDNPSPTFDGFQRGFVDIYVCSRAKTWVKTFPHLAQDPWGGVH